MKKIFVMAVMAAATLTANAQWYVGGTFGLDFTKANKDVDTRTTLTIAPEVGYNLSDKWAVGANIGFNMANELVKFGGDDAGNANETGTGFMIGPYARYTFAKMGMVSFFVDGGVGLIFQNYDLQEGVKYDKSGTIFNIGLRPGVAFKVNDKISLVATTGYFGYRKNSDDVLGGGSKFGLNVNSMALSFGGYYNF
jgi:hypothetical protein